MKLVIALITVIALSGCSTIEKYWPRDHDPAMVTKYVDLEVKLTKVDCASKEGFDGAIKDADWLNRYLNFRGDPQKDSAKLILDNLQKASTSSEAACKRWVNLTNINMNIVKKAWEGR